MGTSRTGVILLAAMIVNACNGSPQNMSQEVNAADNSAEVLQSDTQDQTDHLNELVDELDTESATIGGTKGRQLEQEAKQDEATVQTLQNDAAAKRKMIEEKVQYEVNVAAGND